MYIFPSILMKKKVEVLHTLGASLDLIHNYCPIVPEDNPEFYLTEFHATTWVQSIQEGCDKLLQIHNINDYIIWEHLMNGQATCPYCMVTAGCHDCPYGERYGVCTHNASKWDILCVEIKQQFFPAISYVTPNVKMEDINNILTIKPDEWFNIDADT